MNEETLGTKIATVLSTFFLNYGVLLIGLVCVSVIVLHWYVSYWQVNRDTDHVDLAKRYAVLELFRRYKL